MTGASGLGKSALLKRFMGEQSPQVCQTIYCHLAHLPTNGLLKLVLSQMGELPKRGKDKLTKEQTRHYIDYQVAHHGGDPKIFDEVVKDQIHEFTGGNPRGINNAAIACLLQATSKRSMRIDEETFRQASIELHWN